MTTTVRKIVRIDEEKCNGCGLCVPECEEGALQIVDGKAKLVDDRYCDGLGDCVGDCPRDAIEIVEREATEFDEDAVEERRKELQRGRGGGEHEGSCPGAAMMDVADPPGDPVESAPGEKSSALRQWPVQLHLVPVGAPYLEGADLLLAADCVPFAVPDFHQRILSGHRVLSGCPKLDDAGAYVEKLTSILRENAIRSLTVAHMEVPCCRGMVAIARKAIEESGSDVSFRTVEASIDGECASPATV